MAFLPQDKTQRRKFTLFRDAGDVVVAGGGEKSRNSPRKIGF